MTTLQTFILGACFGAGVLAVLYLVLHPLGSVPRHGYNGLPPVGPGKPMPTVKPPKRPDPDEWITVGLKIDPSQAEALKRAIEENSLEVAHAIAAATRPAAANEEPPRQRYGDGGYYTASEFQLAGWLGLRLDDPGEDEQFRRAIRAWFDERACSL